MLSRKKKHAELNKHLGNKQMGLGYCPKHLIMTTTALRQCVYVHRTELPITYLFIFTYTQMYVVFDFNFVNCAGCLLGDGITKKTERTGNVCVCVCERASEGSSWEHKTLLENFLNNISSTDHQPASSTEPTYVMRGARDDRRLVIRRNNERARDCSNIYTQNHIYLTNELTQLTAFY